MFQFSGFASLAGYPVLQRDGLPHSDTCGSKVICTSPQFFAACHVLLRLWEPRHPPYALINFFLLYLFLFFSENCSIFTHINTSKNNTALFSRFSLYYMYLSSMSKNFIKYLAFLTGILMQARFFNLCPLLRENRESNPDLFYLAHPVLLSGFVLIRQQAARTFFSR